ncbi:MAG: hypothetical protein WBA45_07125 [Microthrixaceae bacterium]
MDELDAPRPKRRGWLYITLTALGLLCVVWLYILFFYHPESLIDELSDKTFPTEAEKICAASRVTLDELPFASLAKTADERADNLAESNVVLREMIADLRPIAPKTPADESEAVNEWLDDWSVYIGNREQYVDNLHKDPKARFLESPKGDGTKGITRAIDGFAQVNRMNSCTTLMDVS